MKKKALNQLLMVVLIFQIMLLLNIVSVAVQKHLILLLNLKPMSIHCLLVPIQSLIQLLI